MHHGLFLQIHKKTANKQVHKFSIHSRSIKTSAWQKQEKEITRGGRGIYSIVINKSTKTILNN